MDTFQTIYLMNETSNLIGQMLFDVIMVTFAIIGVALLFGDKLTKEIVIGISVLSSAWALPMIAIAHDQLQALGVMARTLTADDLGQLEGLSKYIGSESITSEPWPPLLLAAIHILTFAAALWFLNYARVRASTTA